MNIRSEFDRAQIARMGFKWVLVHPRGERKGHVASRHRTYEAAEKAAKGRELAIVEVAEGHTF